MKELLKLMQERQSARIPLDTKRPIAKDDLLQILEAGRWAPTAHNMQNFEIIVVDNKKLMESIGNIKRSISETFIRENYQQLSFSEEELLRKKTGLLAAMFPPSWRNPDFRVDNSGKEVKSILHIPQNLNINFPCRLGYTVSPPVKHLRVRRDIKDFIYFNIFGSKGS
jgi:hypothetical protein